MHSVVPLVNRNVLRAPRAANASVCYARESVTEGTGRTRLIVRLSQCNVSRTNRIYGKTECDTSAWSRGKVKELRNDITMKEGKEKDRARRMQPAWRFKIMLRLCALHAN